MIKPIERILHSLLLLILIGAFGSSMYYIKTAPNTTPVPSVTPVVTFVPIATSTRGFTPAATRPPALVPTHVPSHASTTESTPDTGWSLLQPGLERRLIRIFNAQNQLVETMYIWRLDQKYFRFDVAFDQKGKSLEGWQKETSASLVMNGGYFRTENEKYFPNGLTILNGRSSGKSYQGYGGMLAINEYQAEVRWLVEKPYNAQEALHAALQSFPILVKPGGQLGFGPEREDHRPARRTVIGEDREGRILFILAPRGYFTLHQLSVYLTESDLKLDIALNLDGGGSTGILVSNPREMISPGTLLPFVVLVYPR